MEKDQNYFPSVIKDKKRISCVLLLPESIHIVLFGMMGWGVVALYLMFVNACKNVCTEQVVHH